MPMPVHSQPNTSLTPFDRVFLHPNPFVVPSTSTLRPPHNCLPKFSDTSFISGSTVLHKDQWNSTLRLLDPLHSSKFSKLLAKPRQLCSPSTSTRTLTCFVNILISKGLAPGSSRQVGQACNIHSKILAPRKDGRSSLYNLKVFSCMRYLTRFTRDLWKSASMRENGKTVKYFGILDYGTEKLVEFYLLRGGDKGNIYLITDLTENGDKGCSFALSNGCRCWR